MRLKAEFRWKGDHVLDDFTRGAEKGVKLAAKHVRGVAVNRAPKDTGALRNTGTATTDGLTGAVSFDTEYAVPQHEEETWHHEDGQAKYLESALDDEVDVARQIIAAQIRKATRS
ncbi:hypothetical protein AB0M80_08250 [Amycolatopsis sp. NPDC051045]|uniref:hypothetical protein n=1 Tax=Amycolatopsis sp. NPDC051045 TaxID=3156922 RepID=UPI00341F148B